MDFAPYMVEVARLLWGDPQPGRTATEIRFGQGGRTVNPQTGTWYVHSDQAGGGVLDLITREAPGVGTKGEAVEWLRQHGFSVDEGSTYRPQANGHQRAPQPRQTHTQDQPTTAPRGRIVKTWDYVDEAGSLLFQVCRIEDGTVDPETGKPNKTFRQRRPDKSARDGWNWSVKGVRQVPYRLPDVIEAISQGLTVFITEGEKAADTCWQMGVPATCNAGGAGKWPEEFGTLLKGIHAVVLPDNDEPGRKHRDLVGRSLKPVAESLRVLDLPGLPPKGDVYEWAQQGGGADALYDLADTQGRPWVPAFESRFGAIPWARLADAGVAYEWLVKGLITRGELSMLAGPSQSGKSFVAIDLAMAVARGIDWMGRRVRQGGVIYQAGEGMKGLRYKRIPAYRIHNRLSHDDDIPFVLLTKKLDLYGSDDQTNQLIEECKAHASTFRVPLELVVIDTWSAATPGMAENHSEDVSRVLERCHRLSDALNCTVLLVHHLNSQGERVRGHSSITADLDSVIVCMKQDGMHDDAGRQIRTLTTAKVKDDQSDAPPIRFTLTSVEIGHDHEGDVQTSCIISVPQVGNVTEEPRKWKLNETERWFLRALQDAMEAHGIDAPVSLALPRSIRRVVDYEHVKRVVAMQNPDDGNDPKAHAEKIKKRVQRAREGLMRARLIGVSAPYVWPVEQDPYEPSGPAPAGPPNDDPLAGWS